MSVARFPSMKGRELERILCTTPLNYHVERQNGSHKRLMSEKFPPLTFSYHNSHSIPPGAVRKILTVDVGLSELEALRILGR